MQDFLAGKSYANCLKCKKADEIIALKQGINLPDTDNALSLVAAIDIEARQIADSYAEMCTEAKNSAVEELLEQIIVNVYRTKIGEL